MQAGWYERNGPAAEVIEIGDLDMPEPGPGEVRLRIYCSGINPSDVKRRDGWGGQVIEFPRVVPHSDGAGIIDAVGAGVPDGRVGERVWTYNAQWRRAFGTAAEYITIAASQAVRLPDSTGFDMAACLGIPAFTAHRALFADGPVAGCEILVTGGAGAVGNYAVQLAKWGGARVIATTSSDAKAAVAREVGADHVVDYKQEDVAERVMALTDGRGIDRIIEVDLGANLPVTQAVLKQNGSIAPYASMREPMPTLDSYALMRRNALIRYVFVYEMPQAAFEAGIRDITTWLETGKAHPGIAASFPLGDLAAAHQAVESGEMIGNVVVDITAA